MANLPRFLALERQARFLQYEMNAGEWHGTLRLLSPVVLSETNLTKLEIVQTQLGSNLIHIRTCYNNKFLRLNPAGGPLLVAAADEPVEDRANEACTLFRFDFTSRPRVALWHLYQNRERAVSVLSSSQCLGTENTTTISNFLGTNDLRTLAILPRHVVFKGDNGRYLRARNNRWLEFTADEPTDGQAHYTAHTLYNGNVRLRSNRFNLYWQRMNNNWLRCEGSQGGHLNTVFRPVRLTSQNNNIALLNTDNNRYCERWTSGSNANYYRATATTAIRQTELTVEEAIRDREISDIRYKLHEARVYSMVPISTVQSIVENRSNQTVTQKAKFKYTELSEETFRSSHSWKVSLRSELKVRVIPKLVEGKLTLDASYAGNVEWEKTTRTSKEMSSATDVPVPPRSMMRVDLIVGRGYCDVPYTYKQRDYLLDGTQEVKTLHDGLFTGLSTFEFYHRIGESEPLPSYGLNRVSDHDDLPRHYDDLPISPSNDLPRQYDDHPTSEEEDYERDEDNVAPVPMSSKL